MLKELVDNCNSCLFSNIAIKQQNIELLGKSLLYLSSGCQLSERYFKPQILYDFNRYSNQPFFFWAIELNRILTLQNENEFTDLEIVKGYNSEFVFPKLSQSRIQELREMIYLDKNYLHKLRNFDYLSVTKEAINYLEKFDFSSESPLSHKKNASELCRRLGEFTISAWKFCKYLQTVKPQINLTYDSSLPQRVALLEAFLKNKQMEQQQQYEEVAVREEKQNSSNNTNELEELIASQLNKYSKRRKGIYSFITPFYFYLQTHTDFGDWVKNGRPLTIWSIVENDNDNEKLKDLIPLDQIKNDKSFINDISFGIDFFLILKPDEIKKITHLYVWIKEEKEAIQLFQYFDKLSSLQLRVLELSRLFMDFVILKKEYLSSLIIFMQTQIESLEEFEVDYKRLEKNESVLFAIIVELKKFTYLKRLKIMNQKILFTISQINAIYDSFKSLTNLECLSYSEYSIREKGGVVAEQQIFPVSLKNLKVTSFDNQRCVQILTQLSSLKQLQKLEIQCPGWLEEVDINLLLGGLSLNLKNINLNSLKLVFENNSWQAHIGAFMKLYQLKRLVQISPNLQQIRENNYPYYGGEG